MALTKSTSQEAGRTPYVIRRAYEAELQLLPAIEIKAGALFAEAGLSEVADNDPAELTYLQSFYRSGHVHVAADKEDVPVGFILSSSIDGFGHIFEVSVDPAHGRQGLGRALVQAACSVAQANDLKAMTLSTFRDLSWNGPFYQRLGFRELGPDEWTPVMHLLHAHEKELQLPVERRCFMRKEIR